MSARRVAGLLLVVSCAQRGPVTLSPEQLQLRATRTISGAFDEVYDATWLTLEAAGWAVSASDRRAGTLSTAMVAADHGPGRAWSATVSQEGATVVLTLLPRIYDGAREVTADLQWILEGPGGEGERWDTLFAGATGLVEAWRVHPELRMSNSRGEVDAVGLRLLVPSWQHFEFSTDRRSMVMQQSGAGGVPTLLYRVERRRPNPDLDTLISDTLEHAFHADGKITVPPQWKPVKDAWGESAEGDVQVGADLTPKRVRWIRWEAGNPAWVVRVVGACPDEAWVTGYSTGTDGGSERSATVTSGAACVADVRRVIESAVNTAPLPGIRPR